MRDSRTRTSANSAATKKPFRPTRTRATKRLNQDKRGSGTSTRAHRRSGNRVFVGGVYSEVLSFRYGAYYPAADCPHQSQSTKGGPTSVAGPLRLTLLKAISTPGP